VACSAPARPEGGCYVVGPRAMAKKVPIDASLFACSATACPFLVARVSGNLLTDSNADRRKSAWLSRRCQLPNFRI
jgi:hypothetical protein